MANQTKFSFGPLTEYEFTHALKQLVLDLTFYARGPVKIHLVGGEHLAYTFNTEDKLHAINIVINPSLLKKVRHKDRAILILRGIGFHELAHHLWPAEDQYKQAIQEGFKSLFNLIDDEQNERRGRSLDPKWGACFQTVCAYIFPSRRKKASTIQVGIVDGNEKEQENFYGFEAEEEYAKRWSEFAYYLRRHLTGEKTPVVSQALDLIPPNFKDLSKPELLALTREVHLTLSQGIKLLKNLPAETEAETTNSSKEDNDDDSTEDLLEVDGGINSFSLRSLLTSKWTYIGFAVFVLAWAALFSQGGSNFWVRVLIQGLCVIAGIAVIFWLLKKLKDFVQSLPPDQSPPKEKKEGWLKRFAKRLGERIGNGLERFATSTAQSRFGRLVKVCWYHTGVFLHRWASRLKRLAFRIWRNRWVRIFLVAVVPALWLVIFWSVIVQSAEINWIYATLVTLAFLLLSFFLWFYRHKIRDFLVEEFNADSDLPHNFHTTFEMDKETLAFNVLDDVAVIEPDPDYLSSVQEELDPLGRQLRKQLVDCGTRPTACDNQPDGYDFIDEIELLKMGETAVFVDDQEEQFASLHIEVAVDCSTSMLMANKTLKEGEKFDLAKRFALAVENAIANQPGMSGHFWGFTDRQIFDCGTAGEGRVSGLKCSGGNNDSAMLWHMGQHAERSDKAIKLLFMLSDGQPSDCSWGSLNQLVLKFEAKGMIPWQFALDKIDDPAFERYFTDLCGQSMAEAIMTMGRTLASLAEGL